MRRLLKPTRERMALAHLTRSVMEELHDAARTIGAYAGVAAYCGLSTGQGWLVDRSGVTFRPAIAPSTCQQCGHGIEWLYDDEGAYGWYVIRGTDQHLCGATEDGYHWPIGATAENGHPVEELERG